MKRIFNSMKDKLRSITKKLQGQLKSWSSRTKKVENLEATDSKQTGKKVTKEQLLNYLQKNSSKFKEILGRGLSKLRKNSKDSDDVEADKGSFNFDEIISDFFHPNNRKTLHRIFFYSLIISSTFTLGKILGLLLTPNQVTQTKKPSMNMVAKRTNDIRSEMEMIKTADIFNSRNDNAETKKPKNENIICLKSESPSSLPVKLLSTVVLQDSVKSVASVQVRGDELINLREGERIQTMAEIGKIDRLKVVIKNLESGECEFIGNDKDGGEQVALNVISPKKGRPLLQRVKNSSIQTDGKKFSIKKKLRDDMLKDIGKILSQARAIQIRNPDGSFCFKMTEIEPGSVYSMLDIQDGDTICEVNGSKINDINTLMNMFGRIREIENFSLGLNREGEALNKTYQFVD
jgi:type II secretion system protein C